MANITKKPNGTYLVRVSRGTDSNGKQIIKSRIFKPSSPRLSYSKLEAELGDFIRKFEDELNGLYVEENKKAPITFSQFVPIYLETKKTTLSPTTLPFYERVIETELIPRFGKMRLDEIRTYHVQQFIQYLSNEMPRKDGVDGRIKPQTVKRYSTVLRSILTLAYKLEYMDDDVGQSRRIAFPKEVAPDIEVYSNEEVQAIIESLSDEPLHIRAIVETALFTGCRRGELAGLKWSDIDFENKTLSVKRSIYKPHGEKPKEKLPKSLSSIRTIAIPDRLCETLLEYKSQQDRHISFLGGKWNDGDYLFTQEDGSVMNPQTPTKIFDHFLKRHNIRHLKFHGLRHTSATLLLSQGCDIKTVSARLGHSDIETTGIYLHVLESVDRSAAAKFDAMIGQKKQ